MSIALVLSRPLHGKGFFRTIVLTPLGIPTIVSATIMTYIFDTSGYLNEVLYKLGLLGEVPIDWAQGGWLSICMVVFADTWKVLPLMVLLFIDWSGSDPPQRARGVADRRFATHIQVFHRHATADKAVYHHGPHPQGH